MLAHGTEIALLNPPGYNSCHHTLYHLSQERKPEAGNKIEEESQIEGKHKIRWERR